LYKTKDAAALDDATVARRAGTTARPARITAGIPFGIKTNAVYKYKMAKTVKY
jgi:hypothetical protein